MAETSSGDRLKQPYFLQNKLDILGQFRAFGWKPQDLVVWTGREGYRLGAAFAAPGLRPGSSGPARCSPGPARAGHRLPRRPDGAGS